MPEGARFSEELIKQDQNTTAGADAIIEQVTRRQRRRLRWWAALTIVLWIVTALYLGGLIMAHLVFVQPYLHEFLSNEEARHVDLSVVGYKLILELKVLLIWPIFLFLAAGCTIAFTLVSRRATLTQLQTSLRQISAEIRNLSSKPREA